MKRCLSFALLLLLSINLTACTTMSKDAAQNTDSTKGNGRLTPYKLTDREQRLLDAFGVGQSVALFDLTAPKDATSLYISGYVMRNGGEWEKLGSSLAVYDDSDDSMLFPNGALSLQVNQDHSIDFRGSASGIVVSVGPDFEIILSDIQFLDQATEISLNQEVPLVIVSYDKDGYYIPLIPNDFFNSDRLDNSDFVQAVTLKFTDQALEDIHPHPKE